MPLCPMCQQPASKRNGRDPRGRQKYACRSCQRTFTEDTASAFSGYRWPADVILTAVRWYLAYPLSSRQVLELLAERGIDVSLCIHLKYFPRLRKRFRSSNLLERSLEEVRRRTKVIGRFPGETSCLSLCWAVLDLFIGGARGLGLTALEYRQVVHLKVARAEHDGDLAKIA